MDKEVMPTEIKNRRSYHLPGTKTFPIDHSHWERLLITESLSRFSRNEKRNARSIRQDRRTRDVSSGKDGI